MTRIRKALVVLSVVAAMTAVSVPAQAGVIEEAVGDASCLIDAVKYGWNTSVCVGP